MALLLLARHFVRVLQLLCRAFGAIVSLGYLASLAVYSSWQQEDQAGILSVGVYSSYMKHALTYVACARLCLLQHLATGL